MNFQGTFLLIFAMMRENEEQIQLFQKNYANLINRKGKIFVDLWDSIERDLLDYGIPRENYENSKICTVCQKEIFASHRGDHPRTTTNLSVISLVEASEKNKFSRFYEDFCSQPEQYDD